ncbi:MAG: ADP-ribosylglycohydrolase family protein [Anaerolineae bacterium]|nr:ADP-ribosylglycohydrolase family protein [Anaerolineae bacterium]
MSVTQAQAILLGLALGDALGAPVEFMGLAEISARYGSGGIQEPPNPALYTDDTQMTLALAEGLIEAGEADPDALMSAVGKYFVRWLNSPDNGRSPGGACLAGVRRYERGESWRRSGLPDSRGCGSAMRVAPIGYLYQHDPERLRDVAQATSLITHGHPTALAASVAAAYLVKLALDGIAPDHYLHEVAVSVDGLSDELDLALRRVGHVLAWGDEIMAMRHIGAGWVAEEAVSLALYCVMRYPDDYVAAVRRAANMDGDSDSVACIAGGVAAARLGMESIPADWRDRCENRDGILDLGAHLAEKRLRIAEHRDGC